MSIVITQGYGTGQGGGGGGSGGSTPTWPLPGTDALSGILLAVQAQLQLALSWGIERVCLVDPAKLSFHPHGDSYVCVWPDTELANNGVYQGAGRLDFRLTRKLYVNLRTRAALDDSATSAVWMTDQTLGHGVGELGIWNALVEYMPVDSKGNQLSLAALTPVNGGKPRLDPEEKEWGETSFAFEVIYAPAIATPPY